MISKFKCFQDPNKWFLKYAVLKILQRIRKPLWFRNEFENGISKKRQALKRFRKEPPAAIKIGLLKISQKTRQSVKEAKYNHFSIVFSNCMHKPENFS